MNAKDRAPAPPTTAGDELRRMLAEKIIRYYRHEDRKRTYRICDPAGYEAIREMAPELLEHAELMTGRKGSRYSGGSRYRLKKRREASLINALLESGIIIDGVRYSSGEFKICSPTLTDAEGIIRSTPRREPLFISGAVLKKAAPGAEHSRREMSISAGTLFDGQSAMTAYVLSTAKYRWYAASETQASMDVKRLYEDALDIERGKDRRLRAMLFTDTAETAKDILKLSLDEESSVDPSSVFRLCYMTPMEDEVNAADAARMLMIKNWKSKANAALSISPAPPGQECDGIAADGKRIHNLLCCNIGKTKEIQKEIRGGRCRLIVHDWQKIALEEALGTGIDAMVLSPIHFRGLLIAVQSS